MEDIVNNIINDNYKNVIKKEVICDESSCGKGIYLLLVTDEFENIKLLDRHRIFQDLLNNNIDNIHKITLKLFTKKEAEAKNILNN